MAGWVIKDEKTPRELVEEGGYHGILVGLYDIGTQPAFRPGDRPQRQVVLEIELHDRRNGEAVRKSDGTVAMQYAFMSLAIGRNNKNEKTKFREYLEAFCNKKFSDEACKSGIDASCALEGVALVSIENAYGTDGKPSGKQKIVGIMPIDEDAADRAKRAIVSNTHTYLIDDGPIPDNIPKWLHEYIGRSAERSGQGKAQNNGNRGNVQPARRQEEDRPAPRRKAAAPPPPSDENGDEDIPF